MKFTLYFIDNRTTREYSTLERPMKDEFLECDGNFYQIKLVFHKQNGGVVVAVTGILGIHDEATKIAAKIWDAINTQ